MVKAVQAHADVPWVVLYVKRWLTAPMQLPDGTLRQTTNHYRFDDSGKIASLTVYMRG